MNGAKLLLNSLEKHGVNKIFGIPGGALLKLYHEINDSNIQHILTRHEQGAIHAADGYARATGKVGACLATSGPGAANLICGLANAYMDSVPLVAITGQVNKEVLGTDAFQEVNTVSLSSSITKHNYLIKDANEIVKVLDEAFYVAQNGRPGPVLIDICANVFSQEIEPKLNYVIDKHIIEKFMLPQATDSDIDSVIEAINNSKKPLFLVGNGVTLSKGADEELKKIIDHTGALVTNTLHGKGAFLESHPNSLRMLGMHGTLEANYGIQNCDLLINVGSRFDNRVTACVKRFAEKAESIVHVDIDQSELSKNIEANIEIISDSFVFLNKLVDRLEEIEIKNLNSWREEVLSKRNFTKREDVEICPANISKVINECIDEDTIIVTDVGQHQMFAAQHMYPKVMRSFISSGGLGTMGYGLPAAIGCAFGNPDKNIILITGDGSIQMTLQELILLREYNLNIKVVIYDNNALGMVRQLQDVYCDRKYSHTNFEIGPNWSDLAKAYHMKYSEIYGEKAIPLLKESILEKGPKIIGIMLPEETNVFPMVTNNSSLSQVKEGL